MESEFLAQISRRRRAFLTRTAVLERMCGSLCDAVLERNGSAEILADLERSNLLLVPLDRRGQWYRYHRLFRDMLLAELYRLEPGLMPVLYRRAAQWHERNGEPAEALEYWMKAGEADSAARLVGTLAFPAYQRGRVATAERWFSWLDDHAPRGTYPAVADLAAMISALTGKPGQAELWAEVAERGAATASLPDGSPTIEPWLALLRALLCRRGVEQMRADAELAARTMAAGSFWRTAATLYLGEAHLMVGDPDRADVLFQDAAATGQAGGASTGACVALADVAAARILLQEIEEVLTRHPALGIFAGQAGDLRAELSSARRSSAPGASALTAAELRLLPMLPTHLSFPQIGEEMFLSPNTVKSHAVSIYRKLGATSRSQAVTRSRELGLLEG
jgi:LuxR family maltose regulon positive regulatory protein